VAALSVAMNSTPVRLTLGAGIVLALIGCGDRDTAQLALGKRIYDQHCAACHGANFQGQPDWRKRLPNGRLPAPPHDASGHTWHHSDRVLFEIVKNGLVPPNAPAGYESDMPAFGNRLADSEIGAVIAYIKSTWPEKQRDLQARVTADDRTARNSK
jgi:S-disulfanyl-L-cysteine oxidoreductase SoxD